MRRPTQGCLFESDRPRWNELESSTREILRQLMQQLLLEASRRAEVTAEFYASATRKPAIYRGNPFLVEVGLAYGGELSGDDIGADIRVGQHLLDNLSRCP